MVRQLKTDVDFKNKWFIIKGAWLLNPGGTHLWEPYVSYYIWDPDMKEDSSETAYGDAANFIGQGSRGKENLTLGKIKVTSVGINYWYSRAKLFRWTLAVTLQFRFVF